MQAAVSCSGTDSGQAGKEVATTSALGAAALLFFRPGFAAPAPAAASPLALPFCCAAGSGAPSCFMLPLAGVLFAGGGTRSPVACMPGHQALQATGTCLQWR